MIDNIKIADYTIQKKLYRKKFNPIYTLYQVTKNNVTYKAKIYNKKQIQKYQISQNVQYNSQLFWNLRNQQCLLNLIDIIQFQKGQIHIYQYFEQNLLEYIEYKNISQKQVYSILIDIINALITLITKKYFPINIRPENFVRVGNKWKIQSVVFQRQYQKYQGLTSQYVWDATYQFPEAYLQANLEQYQLRNSLGWSLGCICLHMLESAHSLNNQSAIKQFCKKKLNNIGDKYNKFGQILQKMLALNKQRRISFMQLIEGQFFKFKLNQKTLSLIKYNLKLRSNQQDQKQRNKRIYKFRVQVKQKNKIKTLQQQNYFQQYLLTKSENLLDTYKSFSTSNQFLLFTSQQLMIHSVDVKNIDHDIKINEQRFSNSAMKRKERLESDLQFFDEKLPVESIIQNTSQEFNMIEINENLSSIIKRKQNSNNKQSQTKSKKQQKKKQQQIKSSQHSNSSFKKSAKNQSFQSFLSNFQIKDSIQISTNMLKILQKYKQQIDKCDFLDLVSTKVQKIPFTKHNQQKQLITQYILLFCSLVYLYQLLKSFQRNQNFFKIDSHDFTALQKTPNYQIIKKLCNESFNQKMRKLQELKRNLKNIQINKLQYKNSQLIVQIINSNPKQIDFLHLKIPYRSVLTPCYSIISREYNKKSSKQLMVIGGYILFALAIDKVFIAEDIESNFALYYKYNKLESGGAIQLHKIKNYIEKANPDYIIKHANFILQKYYKI